MSRIRRKKPDTFIVPPGYVGPLAALPGWSWNDGGPRTRAKYAEDKAQRDREDDFESVWWAAWNYFMEHLGGDVWRTDVDGTREKVSFYHASLFYAFALRKAYGLGKLRFRLSEAGLTHDQMLVVSNLKDGRSWRGAEKTLTRTLPTKLVEITNKSPRGDDYTIEIFQPPNPGKRYKLSAATRKHGHVSRVHPRIHEIDHSSEMDTRLLAERS